MIEDRAVGVVPSLADAIDRTPLIVAPDMSVIEVIGMISQSHDRTCQLNAVAAVERPELLARSASCVLIMECDRLLGILTERDVVRLAADGVDLEGVPISAVMIHPVITLFDAMLQDIFAALFLFRRYRIRHLPVVNGTGKLIGVISHESIRQILRPANLLRHRRVADVMTDQVIRAPLTASVLELAKLMATNQVSCVVIMQPDEFQNAVPVGIVTERDIVQFQALQINLAKTQAQTVMSTPLFVLSPEDSLWTAHEEMQKHRVGRLVVSWNWRQGLGLVTQTSLLRVFDPVEMYSVIEDLQDTIQELQTRAANPDAHLPVRSTSLDLAQVAYRRFVIDRAIAAANHHGPAADRRTDGDVGPLLEQMQRIVIQVLAAAPISSLQTKQLQSVVNMLSQAQDLLHSRS